MRIQTLPAGATSVRLELHGIINLPAFFQLEEAILKVIKKNIFRIELEMSDVKHMDYRGVEILVKRAERLRGYGGDLMLCSMSPYLINILQMAGAADTFEIAAPQLPSQGDLFQRQEKSLPAVA
ncbi:MAG: STAS domain-containing protein [Candidatus Edwardsbacteria bacterium]|nr:STAS domain-containing protein [Candidatus Edwardsbacteria bacterium]